MADRQTEEQRRAQAERRKYARYRSYIRMAAILLALVLSIAALAQSCSAKKTAVSAQETVQEAAAAASLQAAAAASEVSVEESPEATTQVSSQTITLNFVGDITLNTLDSGDASYSGSMAEYYDTNGASYFLQNVQSILRSDGLTVANLECDITETTDAADKSSVYKADPAYAEILTEGGIDAVNVANDHTHDYGDAGYTDTLANLDNAGIARFGSDYVHLYEVNGVQVGLLGIYEGDTTADAATLMQNDISSLQSQGAQVIVANLHWSSYNDGPSDEEISLAHAAIDAGANLVVCHHPDPLGGIEEYNGSYIAYSLGQFLYGGSYAVEDYDTMIFSVSFSLGEDGVASTYTVIPCTNSSQTSVNNFCPTPVTGESAAAIISDINAASSSLSGGVNTSDNGTPAGSASTVDNSIADTEPAAEVTAEVSPEVSDETAATADTSIAPNIAAPAA